MEDIGSYRSALLFSPRARAGCGSFNICAVDAKPGDDDHEATPIILTVCLLPQSGVLESGALLSITSFTPGANPTARVSAIRRPGVTHVSQPDSKAVICRLSLLAGMPRPRGSGLSMGTCTALEAEPLL